MSEKNCSPNSVSFTVRDCAKTLAFYRDKLGFELRECWPDEKKPMWANVVLGGQSVMFGAAMKPEDVGKMCGGDAAKEKYWRAQADRFAKNEPGVGVQVYLMVPDVDAYAAKLEKNGVQLVLKPATQFYGLRDTCVADPDGYTLVFYTPVAMSSCQSCGMPLADAKPGQMYCSYCTDDKGLLRPYEQVFEGTVSGYFMGMQKMPRNEAEKAAREHLKKMPAWSARS